MRVSFNKSQQNEEAFFQKHSYMARACFLDVSQFPIRETVFRCRFLFSRCKVYLRYTAGNFNKNPSMRALAKILRARASEHSSNFCAQFEQRPNFANTFKLDGTKMGPFYTSSTGSDPFSQSPSSPYAPVTVTSRYISFDLYFCCVAKIHLPWGVAVRLLDYHLSSRLSALVTVCALGNMAVTEFLQAFCQWQTILIASAILLFVYVCAFYRTVKTWYGDIPGPTPLPLVGLLPDVLRHKGQMHLQIDEYYQKYGKVYQAAIFGRIPCLVVADPEMLKDIFVKEFDCFSDRPVSLKLTYVFKNDVDLDLNHFQQIYAYYIYSRNRGDGWDQKTRETPMNKIIN